MNVLQCGPTMLFAAGRVRMAPNWSNINAVSLGQLSVLPADKSFNVESQPAEYCCMAVPMAAGPCFRLILKHD